MWCHVTGWAVHDISNDGNSFIFKGRDVQEYETLGTAQPVTASYDKRTGSSSPVILATGAVRLYVKEDVVW
jgi:hypothetical protein